MSFIKKTVCVLLTSSKQMNRLPMRVFCSKIPSESVTKSDAPDTQAADADNTTFKCQEYFEHNPMSFYDIELEMEKYRLPQPAPGHN